MEKDLWTKLAEENTEDRADSEVELPEWGRDIEHYELSTPHGDNY